MGKIKTRKSPNFKTVWTTLKEVSEQQKENDRLMKENDRRIEETGRQIEETGRQMKETDKRFGNLEHRFGEMVEYMVVPNLLNKFGELGFVFDKAYEQTKIKNKENNIYAEIGITLENGDKVMIVEVKVKPDIADIEEHIIRMNKVRVHADLHSDRRKFLGAVAGVVINDNMRNYILKNGFYAVEPSGETFNITEPASPKEW